MTFSGCIAGLGNPGQKYERTRHNFGLMLIDYLIEHIHTFPAGTCTALSTGKGKYAAWKCTLGPQSGAWLLIKPHTYMNLSGEAVGHACGFFRIPPRDLIICHDELDLPFGRMKFKTGGGLAGHNGLRSIANHLGSQEFHRLRLGIDKAASGQTAHYVLTPFSNQEAPHLATILEAAAQGLISYVTAGKSAATQTINGFDLSSAPAPKQ